MCWLELSEGGQSQCLWTIEFLSAHSSSVVHDSVAAACLSFTHSGSTDEPRCQVLCWGRPKRSNIGPCCRAVCHPEENKHPHILLLSKASGQNIYDDTLWPAASAAVSPKQSGLGWWLPASQINPWVPFHSPLIAHASTEVSLLMVRSRGKSRGDALTTELCCLAWEEWRKRRRKMKGEKKKPKS